MATNRRLVRFAAGEVENATYGFDGVGDVDHLLEKF
jgi:hypothetical protein